MSVDVLCPSFESVSHSVPVSSSSFFCLFCFALNSCALFLPRFLYLSTIFSSTFIINLGLFADFFRLPLFCLLISACSPSSSVVLKIEKRAASLLSRIPRRFALTVYRDFLAVLIPDSASYRSILGLLS